MSKLVEEWRPVVGYEGLYEVSDWGNVRSLNYNHTKKINLLRKVNGKDGYHIVGLHKDKKQKEGKVHRLVAEAFIPNPDNKEQVGHLKKLPDGTEDKTANEAWNLAWMTCTENINYGSRNKRVAKKISKPVYQYTLDGEFVKKWDSIKECRRNGFLHAGDCCRGERKTHKGHKWSFKPL